MTCERCLVDPKLFIEKNDFKVFKDFDTENASRVMQLSIQIPQTILFLMVHDTHHVNIYRKHIIYKIYIYIYINIIFNN